MDRTTLKINNLLALMHKIRNRGFKILSGGKVRCSTSHDSPFYGGKDCGTKKSTHRK